MTETEFFKIIRRALLMLVHAIEKRYLDKADKPDA